MHRFIFLAGFILLSQLAFSHGGGLNPQGCHNETSTGDYHCHKLTNKANIPKTTSKSSTYNRSDFKYRSYKPNSSKGYYTGLICMSIDVDHVVSLKDAYESGAYSWTAEQKFNFSNDRENHVPSCHDVNRSKGSAGPKDFLRLSQDGQGLDFEIVNFCAYIEKYYAIKLKYGLSFTSNHKKLFTDCGLHI